MIFSFVFRISTFSLEISKKHMQNTYIIKYSDYYKFVVVTSCKKENHFHNIHKMWSYHVLYTWIIIIYATWLCATKCITISIQFVFLLHVLNAFLSLFLFSAIATTAVVTFVENQTQHPYISINRTIFKNEIISKKQTNKRNSSNQSHRFEIEIKKITTTKPSLSNKR